MNSVRKEIYYYGIKPAKSVQRLVQKQIEKWFYREQLTLMPADTSYWVKFEKENLQPFIFCHLRIQLGTKRWEASDCGKTLQDALLQSLKHLKSSLIEPRSYLESQSYAKNVA